AGAPPPRALFAVGGPTVRGPASHPPRRTVAFNGPLEAFKAALRADYDAAKAGDGTARVALQVLATGARFLGPTDAHQHGDSAFIAPKFTPRDPPDTGPFQKVLDQARVFVQKTAPLAAEPLPDPGAYILRLGCFVKHTYLGRDGKPRTYVSKLAWAKLKRPDGTTDRVPAPGVFLRDLPPDYLSRLLQLDFL